ncbi:MAG: alpha-glucan family phosphorylase [Pseudomonadota bacterium]
MRKFQTFQVYPRLPEALKFLETLSHNYWWSWKHPAVDLFRRIDRTLWKKAGGNPIVFLTMVPQQRLKRLAEDESFLAHLERVRAHFNERVRERNTASDPSFGPKDTIAYLSMEFGIHETLPIYSGGLGILAGDHLKASSNMNLPLTGIGLFYRQGYFHQFLDPSGFQQEEYPETEVFSIPMARAVGDDGKEIQVSVPGPDGDIDAMVWKLDIGCISLYLLDTFMQSNPPAIRDITARLYAGGPRVRLAQEALLGIGGIRALNALGITSKVCHMNEGHAAFSGLERLALVMEKHSVDLKTAREIVARSTVFTTHTPVAAGHDEFPPAMVLPVLKRYTDRLGVDEKTILSWGQPAGAPEDSPFSMFILGLRLANYCNGVSKLHGEVARRMWSHVWPDRPVDEVPISHITNGVHIPTWIAPELALLYERYLGPEWYMGSRKPENMARIDEIYDEELWRAHEMSRARLLRACREKILFQLDRRNAPKSVRDDVEAVLDPDALTICFARRFATYKRATLLFRDPERLEAILQNTAQPVQFIFAGKAHPQDNEGKGLIKQIIEFTRRTGVRRKIFFLEDYDVQLGRYLVQGCDVWLNNPRRPYEACGTSGMKAALNGVLNLSILDGWWAEGYTDERGWAIGRGEEQGDPGYIDAVESQALYNLLENGVIPKFYHRRPGEAPTDWIRMMKSSMKMAMQDYCSLRMVNDYDERFYIPAAIWKDRLLANNAEEARMLSAKNERLREQWPQVRIESPERATAGPFRVGESFKVTVLVHLGALKPDEVEVHLYYGLANTVDTVTCSKKVHMDELEARDGGAYLYGCLLDCHDSGRYAFTARVMPSGDDWIKNQPGMITWA